MRSVIVGRHLDPVAPAPNRAERLPPESNGSREGLRAVGISLFVLGLTAAAQMLVYLLSGSVALLADLIHNAGDAATAIPLGVAFLLRSPGRRAHHRSVRRGRHLRLRLLRRPRSDRAPDRRRMSPKLSARSQPPAL